MDDLSVGKRILYPMSFNILLHPDDYNNVCESLPFILPEVIAGFYAAIKTKSESILDSYATPPATDWFFQFASSKTKTENGEDVYIERGEIITIAHLTTLDISKIQRGAKIEDSKLSIKCVNSNVNQTNINQEALLGMDILSNGTFVFKFDKNMSQSQSDIEGSKRDRSNALATLYYDENGQKIPLYMYDNLVTISGPDETRKALNILIINNKAVQKSHIQIQYDKERNTFQLCAFAKTCVNMRVLELSEGGNLKWNSLSYNSNIFLNDTVNIQFKASDAIRTKGPSI